HERKLDHEGRAPAGLGLCSNPAAVRFDEASCNREAEPGAVVSFGFLAPVVKLLKDQALVSWGKPRSVVGNTDAQPSPVHQQTDPDDIRAGVTTRVLED